MGRILALDLGERRTGAAVSDELGYTAQPAGMWERVGYKDDLAGVKKLMAEYQIERIVVGHPLNMDGTRGERAMACERIAEKLKKDLGIEVSLWDERMTTMGAERMMIDAGVRRDKRKKVIDQMAAQLILSGWLTARPDKKPGKDVSGE
ncbi:MAG: Holliday junction resolvase RuvX [Nitrospinae bacterium]|nr:Holliday junction resolvase RuvX [Nitrospinota bacterium]